MQLFRGFDDPALPRAGLLSIGNFDGVHRGHAVLLERLIQRAKENGLPSVVLTFDPPPVRILAPQQCPPQLTTPQQKAELIGKSGVDAVVLYPTDRALLELSPEDFFEQIVVQQLSASGMVEGPNFCFGRDRAGNTDVLEELCREWGLSLDIVRPAERDGRIVSSSEIRRALGAGQIEEANAMLGRAYELAGRVGSGAGRGRSLGFPTANLIGVETMLPGDGVYAGRAHVKEQAYSAAVHLGPNPTFTDGERKLEVHVIGFSGDLYGQSLKVELLSRLRDVRRFDSEQAIRTQIAADVVAAEQAAKFRG